MTHSKTIIQTFTKLFNKKSCRELCQRNKFIERNTSKLKGHEFIKAMILPSEGLSADSLKGLCKRIKEFNPKANLSSQALCERINHISAANLMKEVLAKLLSHMRTNIFQRFEGLADLLTSFNDVLIEDSTVGKLNEKLNEEYPGTNRGGTGAIAQIKIDLIYEVKQGRTVDAAIYKGKDPDQGLSGRIVNYAKPGDLIIRDLGYFVLKVFKVIAALGAYFLSRLQPNVKVYLKNDDKAPLELAEYIKDHYLNYNIIELEVLLGDEKIPSRMILYRQPKDVTDERLRVANARAKETGRTMSKGKRFCLYFAIFITNAPKNLLSAEMVGTVYRLRWEIELVFKRWKSQLQIDYLKGIDKNRIECLVWSRLCSIVIIEIVGGYASLIAKKAFTVEFSDMKFVDYLLRSSKFCTAVAENKLENFIMAIENDIERMLLKDRRQRKTMREKISLGESYYNIRIYEGENAA